MNLEFVQTLPSLLNKAVGSVSLLALLGFSLAHSGSIAEALSTRLGTIHEVEVSGVRVTFDAKDIEKNAARLPIKDLASKQVADEINRLDQRTLVRLMYVGTLSNLCEFEKPNAQMYEAVGTDHRLAELDFVELKDAPELKAVAEKAIRDAEVKSGVKSSIGAPRSCYTMSLTSKGANVRTVITHMFATAFSGTPTLVAQAEAPAIPQAKTPAPGVIAKASKPAKVATLGK